MKFENHLKNYIQSLTLIIYNIRVKLRIVTLNAFG